MRTVSMEQVHVRHHIEPITILRWRLGQLLLNTLPAMPMFDALLISRMLLRYGSAFVSVRSCKHTGGFFARFGTRYAFGEEAQIFQHSSFF